MSAPALVDIGANLLDGMYNGVYGGERRAHAPDLGCVLHRARAAGLRSIIVTSSCLEDTAASISLCRKVNAAGTYAPLRLTCTAGLHPTNAGVLSRLQRGEVEGSGVGGVEEGGARPTTPEAYIAALTALCLSGMAEGIVVAVGEVGLDNDRLHFASGAEQAAALPWQFLLAAQTGLPLFLHDRGATAEVLAAIAAFQLERGLPPSVDGEGRVVPAPPPASSPAERSAAVRGGGGALYPLRGVFHSFTGSLASMHTILAAGFYVGINGCSLKGEEGLSVASAVPLDRLLIETDAPWCGVKQSHASAKHVRTAWRTVKKDKYTPEGSGDGAVVQEVAAAGPTKGAGKGGPPSSLPTAITLLAPGTMVRDRNEPACIIQVAEVLAALRGVSVREIADATTANARALFGRHAVPDGLGAEVE